MKRSDKSNKNKSNIKTIKSQNKKAEWFDKKLDLLLKMLSQTTPYKDEENMHKFLPKGGEFDSEGNYIYVTDKKSKTLFCCHIDTVGYNVKEVNPIYENGWIRVGNKNASCLGGDDRCGILCLLHLIEHKIPGTYYFHIGEERGCIGARHIYNTRNLNQFERAIEFDRKGETSVITEMTVIKTCSEEFANALCKQLGNSFKIDKNGVSTDVKVYEDKIAECTNISVGFRNEHSNCETINADFLINNLLTVIVDVDWDNLPTKRDPKGYNKTYTNYTGNYKKNRNWNDDFDYNNYYPNGRKDDRYNNTIFSFTNHAKILRKNGIIQSSGDLINDQEYIECELCANSIGPFKNICILGTDYLLCEDCCKFLEDGWNSDEFNVEVEMVEELDFLTGNNNVEQNETEEENEHNI